MLVRTERPFRNRDRVSSNLISSSLRTYGDVVLDEHKTILKNSQLRKSKHTDVLRLAKWLHLRGNINEMSHNQLCNLVVCLLKRRGIKERGFE